MRFTAIFQRFIIKICITERGCVDNHRKSNSIHEFTWKIERICNISFIDAQTVYDTTFDIIPAWMLGQKMITCNFTDKTPAVGRRSIADYFTCRIIIYNSTMSEAVPLTINIGYLSWCTDDSCNQCQDDNWGIII